MGQNPYPTLCGIIRGPAVAMRCIDGTRAASRAVNCCLSRSTKSQPRQPQGKTIPTTHRDTVASSALPFTRPQHTQLAIDFYKASLLSHKYPGNYSAHGRFLRPTSCLYATLSPIINLHRVPLYLISLTKLTILHGMSVLKRQLGHALLFGSRGFSVGVCCWRMRGTRDLYFWTPGVGYTPSTIIGLATISVSRIYNTLPSCGFMGPCRVVTAWGRSKRQGGRICIPLAHYVDFQNHLAYTLYAPLYVKGTRRGDNHLQIFHVADIPVGDCAIRSPVSYYASPRSAFHDRFLESHLRRLSYC
ncbi:hypothetical protein V8E53_009174 [Lactarius tabidus]